VSCFLPRKLSMDKGNVSGLTIQYSACENVNKALGRHDHGGGKEGVDAHAKHCHSATPYLTNDASYDQSWAKSVPPWLKSRVRFLCYLPTAKPMYGRLLSNDKRWLGISHLSVTESH